MITQEELDKLLVEMETSRVEKTVSVKDTKKFGQAICAFANDLPNDGKPGYLIIGVHDNGEIAGITVTEKLVQTILDFRDGRIVPPPTIFHKIFPYPEGELLVVEVHPTSLPPVRYNKQIWVRIGQRKDTATEGDERILIEKRSSFARSFDALPCRESTLNDLSINIFKLVYLPTAIDAETLETNHREIKEQLASLKFYHLKANCPTNAGILMFGNNPRFYISGAAVQYVRFTGEDEVSDFDFEHIFSGDLTTQMREMSNFIKSQIVKRVLPDLGEKYELNYPASAIQELLYNAVIHRDYESNAPVKFYEFSDKILISNSGGLYGKARPENFPNENDYRNPVLAEAAKNLGFINSFNVGVKRAKAALARNGNPEPKFTIDQPTGFEVIIYKK